MWLMPELDVILCETYINLSSYFHRQTELSVLFRSIRELVCFTVASRAPRTYINMFLFSRLWHVSF